MLTYRYRGHDSASSANARNAEKRRDEADPVAKARARILADRVASEAALKAIEKDVREMVGAAAASARSAAQPELAELHTSPLT
jgi:pyruvate dehydrogenase E1 component alpha subunit